MSTDANVLRRRDVVSLGIIEQAFHTGPLAECLAAAPSIDHRRGLSVAQFVREYRDLKRPVVLEGLAADWPAVRTWSFEHLAERCGAAQVTIDSYRSKAARRATFAEFVDELKAKTSPGATPIYLQEWYYQTDCPWLADDLPELDIAQYDFRRNLYGLAASTNHQLWLGQQGAVTRLHQDSYMVDVMHAQIYGEKLWYVMGPDAMLCDTEHGSPDLAGLCDSVDTRLARFVLTPGDVLYLPAMWYHRIELLSDSIGLGRKCLDETNLQPHIRQRMAELLALSLNPDEVKRTHPELFDVVVARNRAWAKRMGIDLSKLRP
jgi:hypothetical protein